MTSTPLHPALVHLPLGLAFIIPLLAIGFAWAIWTERIRARGWLLVVLLQVVLVGGGILAVNTGEREEDRVESTVPKQALKEHESFATQFVWLSGITLAVMLGAAVSRRPSVLKAATAAAVIGSFLVAGAALRVGHAGGQLVYTYNAGAAYGANAGNKDTLMDPRSTQMSHMNASAEHHDDD
ncbi:MAG TPA: DUF2231 domain-containing protein [Terriglobales bacterium]|nr:DUF2231 domain-containing protein [Terriglobales bacterium]